MGKTKKSYYGIFIEKCFYNIQIYNSKYRTMNLFFIYEPNYWKGEIKNFS